MFDATAHHLRSLDPSVSPYAEAMVLLARQAGVPLHIISGRRSAEANRAAGGSVNSLHLRGLAFDVKVGDWNRDQVPLWVWTVLGEWWESLGGRWGGRFVPPDVNHFDVGLEG